MPIISGASDLPLPRQAILGRDAGGNIPDPKVNPAPERPVEAPARAERPRPQPDTSQTYQTPASTSERLFQANLDEGFGGIFDELELEPVNIDTSNAFLDRLAELRTADLYGDPPVADEAAPASATPSADGPTQTGRYDKYA